MPTFFIESLNTKKLYISNSITSTQLSGLSYSKQLELSINPTAQVNPYNTFKGKPINNIEPQPNLEAGQADSSVTWDEAKNAVKDAFEKLTGLDKDNKPQ